jgi:hypothetical protein
MGMVKSKHKAERCISRSQSNTTCIVSVWLHKESSTCMCLQLRWRACGLTGCRQVYNNHLLWPAKVANIPGRTFHAFCGSRGWAYADRDSPNSSRHSRASSTWHGNQCIERTARAPAGSDRMDLLLPKPLCFKAFLVFAPAECYYHLEPRSNDMCGLS